MAGGRHGIEFVGKPPLIFWLLATLTIANALVGVVLPYAVEYLFPNRFSDSRPCAALASRGVQFRIPEVVCWYAARWIVIEFILLAMVAATLVVFRMRVRYIRFG